MRRRRPGGAHGFTLIELLVVIAILGVLTTVAVLALGGLGSATGDAACATDAETLRSAQDTAKATVGQELSQSELVEQGFLKHEVELCE